MLPSSQVTGHRSQVTGHRSQVTGHRSQVVFVTCEPKIGDWRLEHTNIVKHGDLKQTFGLPRLRVRQADTISTALGAWSTTDRVAIAIPDHTRPLDVASVLDHLADHLQGESEVIIGLGLHRKMTKRELRSLYRYSPIQHDPDDCLPVALDDGTRVGLSRKIVEADWSISVGVAELHQYAGVSGGYKGVVVGCGSRELIAQLHHREMVCAPGVCIGQVKGNPFRDFIDRIGRASNCRVALVYVPAVQKWLFGLPDAVIEEASRLIEPWHWIPKQAAGAVLRVPESKAGSLYQASRAATYLALSPHPAVKVGGTLILEAAMPEGLGAEQGFVAAMKRFSPPWSEVLSGEGPQGAGAQRIVMMALLAQKYHLVLRGCRYPELFEQIGIEASSEPALVPSGWLDIVRPFARIPQY